MSGMYPCSACFNPRTRTGCDHRLFPARVPYASFNPRTRTGCDFPCPGRGPHHLCFNPRTRTGCDGLILLPFLFYLVSTHAPARGATGIPTVFPVLELVSTHAPARGATTTLDWTKLDTISFNPRTRTGCDTIARSTRSAVTFQPTHPHGVRPPCIYLAKRP